MKNVTGLRCVICQKIYQPDELLYVCPDHGNEGILDVLYDYDAIRADIGEKLPDANEGMFAYRPFLPVAEDVSAPPLVVGGTPLQEAPHLAQAAGVAELWLKDDGRNPTGSLKDRASAVAIMKAKELGAEIVTTASTGNAAAALAGLAASVGQKTVIFVPKSAPAAKIAQLLVYGATVLLVDGTYDDAFDLCLKATEKFGWYCRNTGYNPYMAEGKKTVTFELFAQLMQQRAATSAPITHLFVSVGDGCIISGVYKGVRDLVATGFLPKMPKIVGVQAEGSAFLHDAWANDEDVLTKTPISANTVADSISAGLPRDRMKAVTAVRQTNGAFITVTDEQILAAIPELAQGSGIFVEPASAATYAGFLKAAQNGLIGAKSNVALILTGNGLKDVQSAMKSVGQAMTVPPEITAVERIFHK